MHKKETEEQEKEAKKTMPIQQSQKENEKIVPEKEFLELKETLQRLQAEFENYRKREEEQKKKFLEYANASLLEKFLPVMDSMDKAEQHAKEKEENSNGKSQNEIASIKKQFAMIMKNSGIEEIPSLGKQFDPIIHDCISFEKNNSKEDGIILEELMKGYKLKGIVLRPSKVKVNKIDEHSEAKK